MIRVGDVPAVMLYGMKQFHDQTCEDAGSDQLKIVVGLAPRAAEFAVSLMVFPPKSIPLVLGELTDVLTW